MLTIFFTSGKYSLIAFFIYMSLSGNAQTWDWLASAGGSLSDKATDMDIDADGNLYVCGYYNGTNPHDVVFGPLVTQPNSFGKQGFLAK
ncbi:MAG: hypothetical protein IAF38_22130, partial [Bacteroidia bacterium]|nr:hypothetical protein [Bacteroidia bacterium]